MTTLSPEVCAERMTRLLRKIETLRVQYANMYDPKHGMEYGADNVRFEIELATSTGKRLNAMYKAQTGENYDHRFMA